MFLPGKPICCTLFVVITVPFRVSGNVTTGLLIQQRGVPWPSHFWSVWGDIETNTAQFALVVVFLAHQAWLMLDAIARTLHRGLISRRHLLEWVTAGRAEKSSRHDPRRFLQFMWPAEAITLAALVMISLTRPEALPIALPFLAAWALSPLIAFWSSRRRTEGAMEFAPKDVRTGRIIARRTWRFFETFVGDEDHWLPPDNFQ